MDSSFFIPQLIERGLLLRTAYFDCFAGASGDMLLGALIDAGLPVEVLQEALQGLPLTGYTLSARKVLKKGIACTKCDVLIQGHPDTPESEHHHGPIHRPDTQPHPHRTLKEIRRLIEASRLSDRVKSQSLAIFERLAEAEGKIHGIASDEVHFHEIGAVDSIVDIVGTVVALECLGVERVIASKIPVGSGTVSCAHGILPVPAPATLELLKGVPIYATGIESELTTPTGAAILTTLAERFGPMPSLRIETSGYGAGYFDLPIPNALRVVIGEPEPTCEEDRVQLIETNLDDMNPQFYDYIMERLFSEGAKDVFLTPIIMKKTRPGVILSVITDPALTERLVHVLFKETTTLGVRILETQKRMILHRTLLTVQTPWGEGRVKVRILTDGEKTFQPEYEDCRRLASSAKVPLASVYQEMKRLAESASQAISGEPARS